MRAEGERVGFGDYLMAVGLRPTPPDHKPEPVVTFRRGGIQPMEMPRRYECAVTRKPATPPMEREERAKRRLDLALAFGLFLFPRTAQGRLNLRSFEDRRDAALKAEASPVVHEAFNGRWHRKQQRAARKVGNARKARRGW